MKRIPSAAIPKPGLDIRAAHKLLVPLLVLLSVLPLMQTWNLRDSLLVDDALITLTYSRNLGEGKGFVFNAPPVILGTTTPLWALLCAFWHFLVPDIPLTLIAVLLSGFFWISSIWLIWFFRHDFSIKPWMVLASSAIIAGLNWPETLGMEGYLFMFLMLLAMGLFYRGHFFWSGFSSSLLFLTRGEGILLLAVLLGFLLLRQRRNQGRIGLSGFLRLLSGFAFPFVVWVAYALPTFRQILPNTLAAKIAQANSGLWPSFWDNFWRLWLPSWKSGWRLGASWLNGWIALALLGLALMVRNRRPLGLATAWLGIYFAGYSLLGVAAYPWYMLPIAWIIGLAVAEAVSTLASVLDSRQPRFFRGGWAGLALCLVFVAAIMSPALTGIKTYRPHPKYRIYLKICRWFEQNASPRESIAFFEVGYLGYYTRNPIVDQMGLVTPGATPDIARRDFSSVFWSYRPDYLVVYEGSGFQYHIIADPRFKKDYSPAATFAGLERPLIIFCRRKARANEVDSIAPSMGP